MTKFCSFLISILNVIMIVGYAQPVWADWHKDWEKWSFDYGVNGHAGLELHDVRRNDQSIILKASFPVMRVDYAPGSCNNSPFSDLLEWCNLIPRSSISEMCHAGLLSGPARGNSWCGEKICEREYTIGSRKWLELGITGTEANYVIYQAWYLSDDGIMLARVYSRGEQCAHRTHTHHAYWRFDFDIVQPQNNQVLVYDDLYGTWYQYPQERNATKAGHLSWFVRDGNTGYKGVWIIPGQVNGRDDGQATPFSDQDVAVRLYHPNEEGPWTDHAQGKLELGYDTPQEDIHSAHVVVWYVAHLIHQEPLPTFNPSAPCGDPHFPSVFRQGADCNDVFGAGPMLVMVQSYDYSLTPSKKSGCVIGPVPGGIVSFSAEVKEATIVPPGPGDQPAYIWSVSGSGAAPKDPSTIKGKNFDVKLGDSPGPVDVTVTATLRGVTKTQTLEIYPDTEASAKEKLTFCQRVERLEQLLGQLHTYPNSPINPLGPDDPLAYFATHPYSRETLVQLRSSLQKVQGSMQNTLEQLTPIQLLLRQSLEETENLLQREAAPPPR
jgi:Copper amine oxidase, enzyme domain